MTDEEIRERLAQSQIEFDAAQAKQREQEALTAALAHLSREANAGADGQPWVQPTGAHDACPAGSVRTHRGNRERMNDPGCNVVSPPPPLWPVQRQGDPGRAPDVHGSFGATTKETQ